MITKNDDEVGVDPTTETVHVGETYRVFKINGDNLKAETQFDLRQAGAALQSKRIHTSCSKPLEVGDQFGSVILRGFEQE